MRPTLRAIAALIFLGAASLLQAACSAEPTPTPALDAATVRDRAAEALRTLSTVHFLVRHQDDGGTDMGFAKLTEAEGDGLFPDRASFAAKTISEQFGGLALDFDLIQVGPTTYLRDRISLQWQILPPGTLPIDFSRINDSIADGLASTSGLSLVDGETIGGAKTYLLTGRTASASMRGFVPNAPDGEMIDLEVWAGRDDFIPRRVKMSGVLLNGDPAGMVRFLDLSAFNEPVTVEPPI